MEKTKIHIHFGIISLMILPAAFWCLILHQPYDNPIDTKVLFGVR